MGHSLVISLNTSIVRSQVLSGHTMMKVVIFCLVLVTFAAADFHVHVDEEDRTFCQLSTRNACAAACNGQACTETCISSCGIFSRPFSYTCSAVASCTCISSSCGKCSIWCLIGRVILINSYY